MRTVANTGPDATIQDLFVEVDYMQDASHTDGPYAGFDGDMTAIFTNDSAWTSRNVRTHVEVSQNIGHWNGISFANCSGSNNVNFYTIKNNTSYFDPLRRLVYHYVIEGHSQLNGSCAIWASSGVAEIFGNDVIITLGGGRVTEQIRGTNVHELGHNLYLDHNNNGDNSGGNSCVHSSVMNYRYQMGGWGNAGDPLRAFGYSRGNCPSGNIGGACTNTCTSRCVPNGQVTPKVSCPIATSGPNKGKHVSNGTCDCDRDEWLEPASATANRVSLAFQSSGEAGDGAMSGKVEDETLAEYVQGGLGEQYRMTKEHRAISDRKVQFVKSQGLVEGRDFWRNPENGKLYSVE